MSFLFRLLVHYTVYSASANSFFNLLSISLALSLSLTLSFSLSLSLSLSAAISQDGLVCQCREQKAWHGCRSTLGAGAGKHYYEATVTDEGLCRVGWATSQGSHELGKDKYGFGFGGTGKKSYASQFDDYGEVGLVPFYMQSGVNLLPLFTQ